MKIQEVNRVVLRFLRDVLKKDGTIVKTSKTSEGQSLLTKRAS